MPSSTRRRTMRTAAAWLIAASLIPFAGTGVARAAQTLESALADVERRPEELQPANELRRMCREQHRVERCVEALDALAKRRPELAAVRYQAALAYVDALPGLSLLRQGSLSTHSIDHVTAVLERSPDDWLALYIRGLNNLYWPSWFGRTRRAIADLRRCVDVSERAGAPAPYHALGYAALGDGYVKSGDVPRGVQTWTQGLARFPGSAELQTRVALPAADAPAFVKTQRDLDKPIDTDISFLWRQP